ncbi:MAG: DUF2304 domain-containing protein [Candidatus Aminicenantes bacterium]|nr:DUF2304 domain-containing protein [Candidatus Aminicenantes bacterium]
MPPRYRTGLQPRKKTQRFITMDNFNPHIIQIISVIGSLAFLVFIIFLIRIRRLKEEYAILWLFFGAIFLFLSIFRKSLEFISSLLGIAYPPAALFLILILAVITILIHFSLVISKMKDKQRRLAQQLALLDVQFKKRREESDHNPST